MNKQNRNRLIDTENKLRVARSKRALRGLDEKGQEITKYKIVGNKIAMSV